MEFERLHSPAIEQLIRSAATWFCSERAGLVPRTYRRRQYIYHAADTAQHVGFIQQGSIEILTSARRKSCPTELRFAGDFIGELVLCGQPFRQESALALENVTLRLATVDHFMSFVTEQALSEQLVTYFALALRTQNRRFANMLMEKCERRLAITLLELAERHGGSELVPLHLTQAELGRMIGTTRSRIGYFLKHFRELGLVGHFNSAGVEVNLKRLPEYCR